MQATYHEDYSVPHPNEKVKVTNGVRFFVLLRASLDLRYCRTKLVGVKKKLDRRDAVRERKALSAAHIERSIQKELIERLKSKAYGDAPLNVNEEVWQAVLNRSSKSKEQETEEGLGELEDDETEEEDEEELEEEMEDDWGDREFVSDISGDEDDGLSDLEDAVSEEGSESDEEASEEDDGGKGKLTGKRKAAVLPKTSKGRPEKKPKRMFSVLLCRFFFDSRLTSTFAQVDLGWKWNTSTKWSVLQRRAMHKSVGETGNAQWRPCCNTLVWPLYFLA